MSDFTVHPQCLELGLRAGAITFRDVNISEPPDTLRQRISRQIDRIQQEFETAAEIRALPQIAELHDILRQVGVKPKRHPPSTQKLLELAFKRGDLPQINTLVDAYNLVSVRTRCSLGAHDLELLAPPVTLRLFDGSESFRPLGSGEDQRVVAGEFGYVDASQRVVCRLDSLQADFSKVSATSRRVLLIVEGTKSLSESAWQEVFEMATSSIIEFCGGTTERVYFPSRE